MWDILFFPMNLIFQIWQLDKKKKNALSWVMLSNLILYNLTIKILNIFIDINYKMARKEKKLKGIYLITIETPCPIRIWTILPLSVYESHISNISKWGKYNYISNLFINFHKYNSRRVLQNLKTMADNEC